MMKTSVAMCTYNGEKFLKEQIDSILQQTVAVDEIVICDDGSTDSTHEILRDYERENPGIFRIFINEKNLGSVKNFEKAITLCKNEIIFLSDQDDVWMPEKVAIILKYFKENTEIEVIATNGFGIDENGNLLDVLTIWDVPEMVRLKNQPFDYFNILNLVANIATGATMAIKKDFCSKIIPFPIINGFHHDEWIALISAKENSFALLNDKLISYREHSTQQVGGVFYKNLQKEKQSLIDFFSIEKSERSFSDYKYFLKRLVLAYKRNVNLSKMFPENKFFKENSEFIKTRFEQTRAEAKKNHPFYSALLFTADKITKKRQL